MINIVFLLLLFFMLAGSVEAIDIVRITPPDSTAGEQEDNGIADILMDSEGKLYFESEAVELANLSAELVAKLAEDPERQVRFKVDGAASTIQVIHVLDALRNAGVPELVLLTLESIQ